MIALAAMGHYNDENVGKFFVRPLTVRTHIQRAMMKLHARDRALLVVIAYQTGLVHPTRRAITAVASEPATGSQRWPTTGWSPAPQRRAT